VGFLKSFKGVGAHQKFSTFEPSWKHGGKSTCVSLLVSSCWFLVFSSWFLVSGSLAQSQFPPDTQRQ
jgi:hypothetical protein